MQKKHLFLASFLLLLGLIAVYSNHFHNSFHFDDSHAIINNVYIQDIHNIPKFFADGTTFSSLPSNQSYRPLVTTSLAVDYWLGGGLDPFYFHITQFFLFVLQGVLMFFLFRKIFDLSFPHAWNPVVALFGTAWYLFNPACAETINYIIARTDSISTLFVVLAFTMYACLSFCRKWYLYLIPAGLGVLAKEPAVMFAPLLFVYVALFEKKMSFAKPFFRENFSKAISSVLVTLPAIIFCAAAFLFQQKMQPDTWVSGGTSRYLYLVTQPYVILHYFETFFFPLRLSADTDWTTLTSIADPKAIVGIVFVLVLLWTALRTSADERTRPISFGILWFFIALVPSSSVIPLSEVMNDHRVFFPYIGLALSAVWTAFLFLARIKNKFSSAFSKIIFVLSLLLLSCYAYGTHERNKVWRTEETLWKDVTVKSPGNARGLMNYGLALMGKADYTGAEKYFLDALKLWPNYAYLHINMGVLMEYTARFGEAHQHFNRAITLRPDAPDCYYYYARVLYAQQQDDLASILLEKALQLSRAHIEARYLLMNIYFDRHESEKLRTVAEGTLAIHPNDAKAQGFLTALKGMKSRLELAEAMVKESPSAENYLVLSLEYFYAKRFEDSIKACEAALKLKPDYGLAYNNMCSAYNSLGQWEKAVEAGEKAVQLNPSNQLAKNNLEWARKQMKK